MVLFGLDFFDFGLNLCDFINKSEDFMLNLIDFKNYLRNKFCEI